MEGLGRPKFGIRVSQLSIKWEQSITLEEQSERSTNFVDVQRERKLKSMVSTSCIVTEAPVREMIWARTDSRIIARRYWR